ncbi:MAG: M15 family metallopeptidase [Cytophagales bacterium]
MLRRDFLVGIMATPIFAAFSNSNILSINNQSTNDFFPEDEILGLVEPILCGEQFCLRNEAMEAYLEMAYEAQKSGIKLWCPSAYRDFTYQKNIWNAKYKAMAKLGMKQHHIVNEILQYSSLPGTSRHHWGTDIDIVDALGYQIENPLNFLNFNTLGEFQYLKYWLDNHAKSFGFVEVYTNDSTRTGFKYEPWHFSYAPISKPILKQLLAIDFTQIEALKQCKGYGLFDSTFYSKIKTEYLLGINKELIG